MDTRERHIMHLCSLLTIKRQNAAQNVSGLQEEIEKVVIVMQQEDVAWVEKIMGESIV
ncbi:MAG: hypothetical protein FWG45_06660 [Oscillospiraceae bacterium]|nr:hypothetical protein [Oscillospiraceae bacterium]